MQNQTSGPPAARYPLLRSHPQVMERVRSSGMRRPRVTMWCDGTVQSNPVHPRITYVQTVDSLQLGRNECPTCAVPATPETLAQHPELVERLVDADDATLDASSKKLVRVWCDGTVAHLPAHPRQTYLQQANALARGANACRVCHPSGRQPRIRLGDVEHLRTRLVTDHEAVVGTNSNSEVQVWCDGTVQGNPAHGCVTYLQQALSLARGRNACPSCGNPRRRRLSERPELVRRLVHPQQARLTIGSTEPVQVWCDGLVQGNPEHRWVVYSQPARLLVAGHNQCPSCPDPRGRRPGTRMLDIPGLAERLCDEPDTFRSPNTTRMMRVWCDGEVQGSPAHERVSYRQRANSLARGINRCPRCSQRRTGPTLSKAPER